MALDPEIFKAYDIRGIYGSQIDGDAAEQIGRAFARVIATLAGKPTSALRIALGHDMRLTAPELHARYRSGLVAEGVHVLDAGEVATEVVYYLIGSRELDGGLICTASHNPKAYTGAKLIREGAMALSGDTGIGDVRELIAAGLPAAPGGGSVEQVDWGDGFRAAATAFIDPASVGGLRVVLDGGNGMAGPTVGPILDRLGLELIPTFWKPDGNFPGHEPNPLLPENRDLVIAAVREHGADLGIAFDGDADRCFFIDETGEFVPGDFVTALLARSLLRTHPGSAILYDVRASRAVADTVTAAGGHPYRNRVGHAFFKARMREEGSPVRRRGFRPLLLPRLLLRRLGHDPGAADAGALLARGPSAVAAAGPLPRPLLHLRRDQQRGDRPAGQARRDHGPLRRRPPGHPRRHLGRLRRLALQRAPVQHRAAAAAVP